MPVAIVSLLLPLSFAPASEWTVDDDGPADFSQIADAIASPLVADGDVLLVADSDYASFALGRELQLVAPEGGEFSAHAVTVDGAASVTIAGLSTRWLTLRDVSGPALLDDCRVGLRVFDPQTFMLVYQGGARFGSCAQVIAQRTIFHGSEGCYPTILNETDPGLRAEGSNLALTDCEVYGGHDDVCSGNHPTDSGKPGIVLVDSVVSCTHTQIVAGDSVLSSVLHPAVSMEGSELVFRGGPSRTVRGGRDEFGAFGTAIEGTNSSARINGVRFDPTILPAWVEVPAVPDPWLRIVDDDQIGMERAELYAGAGTFGRIVWGDEALLAQLPDPLDPLWFRRDSILGRRAVVALGLQTPAIERFPSNGPGGTAGVRVFQAYLLPPGSGPAFLTNPALVVERW